MRDGISRTGLTKIDGEKRQYSSSAWLISDAEAKALEGGWIYLHDTKSKASVFGGAIYRIELAEPEEDGRYRIYFEAKEGGKGQDWRGQDHAMAWWSGLVEPDAEHELGSA